MLERRAVGPRLSLLWRGIIQPYPTQGASPMQMVGMRMLWMDTLFANISVNFYADFLSLYMLALGAGAAEIGMRTSLNSATALLAPLVGALLVERTGKRRAWVVWGPGGLARLALLALAAIPCLFKGPAAVQAFMVIAAVQAFFGSVGLPAHNSLLGDILPLGIRGRYVGAQLLGANLVRVATLPLAGWLLRAVGGLAGYQVVWVLAALVGFWATSYYARIPEPKSVEGRGMPGTSGWGEGLRLFLRDKRFVYFTLANLVFNTGVNLSSSFFSVYQVEQLGFSVDTVALINTLVTVVNLVGLRYMGSLVDRSGAARLTMISMLLVPFLPLGWLLASQPWHVGLVQGFGQLAWAGTRVAATPLLLLLTPREQRSRYVAIYNTVVGLAAVLAPMAAGWMYTELGFRVNLWVSGAGRGLGGLCFLALYLWGGLRALDKPAAREGAHATQPVTAVEG